MRKSIIIGIFIFLMTIFVGVQAYLRTDAQGRKWDINDQIAANAQYDHWSMYQGMGDRMSDATKGYLDSNAVINLGALDALLVPLTCPAPNCAAGTIYGGGGWAGTTSWRSIRMGCGNHMLATFEYACPIITPTFSCNGITVNGKTSNGNNEIVIYAADYLNISGLQQTRNGETDCIKYGANSLSLSFGGGSYSTTITERLNAGGISLAGKNIEVKNASGDIINKQIGLYPMVFKFYKNGSDIGNASGICNLRIIADPEGKCGVNSSGNWNGEGDEALGSGEDCDIKADGTQLGTWGDKSPGCNASCQSENWCGDGIINNSEECDYEDISEENWGFVGCSNTCTRDDGTCGDGIKDDNEQCDYEDAQKEGWGSDGCSDLCITGGEQPSIKVAKYSNNNNDLDGNTDHNETDDHQIINKGTSAVFMIKVTNDGGEDLESINLTDSLSSDCEGNLDFTTKKVGNNDVTFYGTGDHLDSYLNAGEFFEYSCRESSVQNGFENTAKVTGLGIISGVSVEDTDSSLVFIDEESINVLKYSGNANDLDGITDDDNETNDIQIVYPGNEAVFKIKVTNYGSDKLENITLEDTISPTCATKSGTIVDLVNKSFVNTNDETINIEVSGDILNNDPYLQVNEYLSYTCKKANTLINYTNTIIATAEEDVGTGTLSNDDFTNVYILTNTCNINGVREAVEACDPSDPAQEGWGAGGCSQNCLPIPISDSCNINGIREVGEMCDMNDPSQEGWGALGCSENCLPIPYIGSCTINGVREDVEACDPNDPAQEGWGANGCSQNCLPIPLSDSCNINGVREVGEMCDMNDPSQEGWGARGCSENCLPIPPEDPCNIDGIKEIWEPCDPNDLSRTGWGTAGCSALCLPIDINCNVNGVKEAGEACDPNDVSKIGWGTGNPGCNQGCEPINASTSSSGGSSNLCRKIEIDTASTDSSTLDTAITCYGNNSTRKLMLDCGNGPTSDRIIMTGSSYMGSKIAVFDGANSCEYDITTDGEKSTPKCFASSVGDITNKTDSRWQTSLTRCQSSVTLGTTIPPCTGDDCGPIIDICTKLQGKAWDINCNKTKTTPDGWSYTIPTYANNNDKKMVCLRVLDHYNNEIELDYFNLMGAAGSWGAGWADTHDNGRPPILIEGLQLNQVNQNGGEAVTIERAAFIDSHICVLMKSKAPGVNRFDFDMSIPEHQETYPLLWNGGYRDVSGESSMNIEFLKPFIGDFAVTPETGGQPKINTDQQYYVLLKEQKTCNFSGGEVNIGRNTTVKNIEPDHIFGTFNNVTKDITNTFTYLGSRYAKFRARIDSQTNAGATKTPGITSDDMIVKYALGGSLVTYYLTAQAGGDDMTPFDINGIVNIETLGLKIIGASQWVGKGDITGQDSNFSDLSKLNQKAKIKKNAYNLIKGRTIVGTVVSNVMYVKGNHTIDYVPNYETIIVEDGNLTIEDDIDRDTIGIIILNSKRDYSKTNYGLYKFGNIYVKPGVKEINAMIYADGAFVSVDNSGVPYYTNSVDRTSALQEQLWLNGAIFSKNTIGGAVTGTSGRYNLPGGSTTAVFNEAMMYDLNYIRSGNNNPVSGDSTNDPYSFIIKFDSKLQANPPKGFKD